MSYQHQARFDPIKLEHAEVKKLFLLAIKTGKTKMRQKGKLGFSAIDPNLIEAASASADAAYALLLIATAEGFMRRYLASIGIVLNDEPKLNTLIDKSYKEFNMRNPTVKIQTDTKSELHNLRKQRNNYTHGSGSIAFPKVGRIVSILGQFFNDFP